MTEKRFNSYCDNDNIRIRIDDGNKEIFHIYFAELEDALYCKSKLNPILDLLNELQMRYDAQRELYAQLDCVKNRLYVENEELKKENDELKKKIGNLEHTRDFCADVCADCERLEKEKEQLKSELRNLRRLTNELYMEGSE